jgi:exodeoxyribonuclease VIII
VIFIDALRSGGCCHDSTDAVQCIEIVKLTFLLLLLFLLLTCSAVPIHHVTGDNAATKERTMTEYHNTDRMSFSGLKQAERSRAHYEAWRRRKDTPTASMALGSYVDALLLDPDALGSFAMRPDTYTDSKGLIKPWTLASNTCKAWIKDNAGKTIISEDQKKDAEKMAASVRVHEEAAIIMGSSGIQKQKEILWTDWETGIDLKSKLDIWCPESRVLADLKTTVDASASAFARTVATYRYHAQLAMYADALQFIGEQRPEKYIIIAVENSEPFCTAVYSINSMDVELGRKWYRKILKKFSDETNNKQTGYSKYAEPLMLPNWLQYEV